MHVSSFIWCLFSSAVLGIFQLWIVYNSKADLINRKYNCTPYNSLGDNRKYIVQNQYFVAYSFGRVMYDLFLCSCYMRWHSTNMFTHLEADWYFSLIAWQTQFPLNTKPYSDPVISDLKTTFYWEWIRLFVTRILNYLLFVDLQNSMPWWKLFIKAHSCTKAFLQVLHYCYQFQFIFT